MTLRGRLGAMAIDPFTKAYTKLNPAQKQAVDTIEGPVMVVAGPGTGKTQILTLRIANILREADITPDGILALTFTESAVISMRRRLAELIGSPAYAVRIATFHSFCNDIIHSYPEAFPRIIGATAIEEVEQIRIMETIIKESKLDILKPFGDPSFYVRPAIRAIRKLKQERILPEVFSQIVVREQELFAALPDKFHEKGRYKGRMKGEHQSADKRLKKAEELVALYSAYEETLMSERLYDYEDMIGEVVGALSDNPDLLLVLQEQYQYMLVDEHQDTNNAQNNLLQLLASYHEQPNLFVVGDTKQAIFRFQGASLENFHYFKKQYTQAELIVLTQNYRSTSPILGAADSLLQGEEPLESETAHVPESVSVASFHTPEAEVYGIAEEVKAQLDAGTEPREIAVLYRDNRDAFGIAAMLERMGLPFQIESNQDVLADANIRKLVMLLRAVSEFGSEGIFLEALHIDFLEIHPLDIAKISAARHGAHQKRRRDVFSIVKSKEALQGLHLESGDAVHTFYRQLAGWKRTEKNKPLPDFVEILIRESGYLSHVVAADDPVEQLDRLQGFFAEVTGLVERKRDASLSDFVEYLDILVAHNILVKSARVSSLANRVRLMTAHRSKGLEFEVVIIAHAADGHWGNKRRTDLLPLPAAVYQLTSTNLEESASLDDERRLFYVALTRAKRYVLITYSLENAQGREQLPSVFLEEIGKDLLHSVDTSAVENAFAQEKDIIFAPKILSGADIEDTAFIQELFAQRGLSVTALNNYLLCPWRYFYRNLLRIPEAPNRYQMFGIAAHASLKRFFDALADTTRDVAPDDAFLTATFQHELMRQPLSEDDLEAFLKKGEEALVGYYRTYRGKWHIRTRNEFSIAGVLLGGTRLTGKLDKLELFDGNVVDVVDYKTGKAKSRNHIEGNTKGSHGDIKRQLVFYRILLDRFEEGRFKMRDGVIDFVEPNPSGKYRQERFSVEDSEVKELEEVIKTVAQEITSLAFWDSRCDDKDCRYCTLRNVVA